MSHLNCLCLFYIFLLTLAFSFVSLWVNMMMQMLHVVSDCIAFVFPFSLYFILKLWVLNGWFLENEKLKLKTEKKHSAVLVPSVCLQRKSKVWLKSSSALVPLRLSVIVASENFAPKISTTAIQFNRNYKMCWFATPVPFCSFTTRQRHWLIFWASWIWYSPSSFCWKLLWN